MFKLVYGHDLEVQAQTVIKKIQYIRNLLNIHCHFWDAKCSFQTSDTWFQTEEM